MSRKTPYDAVVADMDGVITRTATVHERAWKQTFDAYMEQRSQRTGEALRPFSSEDYRRFVDGKPRYDGVRDFLASRDIVLPEGDASDAPGVASVHGLGNRKNALFLRMLEQEGVEVFDDAVAAFDRWRRGGLPIAVISASRNCRPVLQSAGLLDRFDEIVDGRTAERMGLPGKPALMSEAARRLGVAPADAVVLEDATSGIRAGRDSGFGLIVGVDRGGHARDLEQAGADRTVRELIELRFLRRVPSALANLEQVERARGDRALTIFLDYDGTLTPIVENPADARLSEAMRESVRRVSRRCKTAVVSGRDLPDVEQKVAIEGLYYAGSHGFDIAGPEQKMAHAEAEQAVPELRRVERELRARLESIEGVIVEHKRFSVATHYRMVAPSAVDGVKKTVEQVLASAQGLRKLAGKKVIEIQPEVEWNKGRAVRWIMDVLHVDPGETMVVYIGDDETDEDAFSALAGFGLGIRVGSETTSSVADFTLESPDAVQSFLEWLAERETGR